MRIFRYFFVFLIPFLLISCASSPYNTSYKQLAPKSYPKNSNTVVYDYGEADYDEIYDKFFSQYAIIGTSGFITRNATFSKDAQKVGQDNGADFVILFKKYLGNHLEYKEQVSYSNDDKGKQQEKKVETVTKSTYLVANPYFEYRAIYLRNVNNEALTQELKEKNVKCNGSSQLDGIWQRDKSLIKICSDESIIYGFLEDGLSPYGSQDGKKQASANVASAGSYGAFFTYKDTGKDSPFKWHKGDMVFMLPKDNKLRGAMFTNPNKKPMLVEFGVDKFGVLRIDIMENKDMLDSIWYERKERLKAEPKYY